MLSKPHRLPLTQELASLKQKGKKKQGKLITLIIRPRRPSQLSRLATIISKKISLKATSRNKLRRRLLAIAHPFITQKKGFDILILPKRTALQSSFGQLKTELENLLHQL